MPLNNFYYGYVDKKLHIRTIYRFLCTDDTEENRIKIANFIINFVKEEKNEIYKLTKQVTYYLKIKQEIVILITKDEFNYINNLIFKYFEKLEIRNEESIQPII